MIGALIQMSKSDLYQRINASQADDELDEVLYPWWHILIAPHGREERAAKWLQRIDLPIYWPCYAKKIRRRGQLHCHRLYAVLPGLLFVPREIMKVERRDETLQWAGIRGYIRTSGGHPATISKADVEVIRHIEAKLNLPPEAKGVLFKIGQRVKFTNPTYAAFLGGGIVRRIDNEAKIGIEVGQLFGSPRVVNVPAAEIEAA